MSTADAFRTFSGEDFRKRRKEVGLGRDEVAEAAGLTPSVVARIEQRSRYSDAEYAAMVQALVMTDAAEPTADPVMEEEEDPAEQPAAPSRIIWHGVTYGDPVRMIDDPRVHYEFRDYIPPEGKGGEHVVLVEIEDRKVRCTRTPAPWRILRVTGVGVDMSEEAQRLRAEYQTGAEMREVAKKQAAEDRARQLATPDFYEEATG